MSTRRSPPNPRLSPRRSPWMSVSPRKRCQLASASGRRSRAAEHRVGDIIRHSSPKASHPCSNCFGRRSGWFRSTSAESRRRHADRAPSVAAPGGASPRNSPVRAAAAGGCGGSRSRDSRGWRRASSVTDVMHGDPGRVTFTLDRSIRGRSRACGRTHPPRRAAPFGPHRRVAARASPSRRAPPASAMNVRLEASARRSARRQSCRRG